VPGQRFNQEVPNGCGCRRSGARNRAPAHHAVKASAGIAATVTPFRSAVLPYPYGTCLFLVPVLIALCWLVTDVRPLAVVILQILVWRVFYWVAIAFSRANDNRVNQPMTVVMA
jgi:hypothetical protein